jgi:predicted ester cyclase
VSLEENKAIVRRLVEAFNRHDPALLDEFIAADFVDGRDTPSELRGLESFKKFEASFNKGFPDCRETIEDIVTEGDRVWVIEKVTGTHAGKWSFLGTTYAPTGKRMSFTALWIYRIIDGKIVERKSVTDMLVFLQQLGVIELTEKGRKLFPDLITALA